VREWQLSLPEIPVTEQRCFSPNEMLQIVNAVTVNGKSCSQRWLLRGCDVAKRSGFHVDDLDLATGRIYVRRSVWNGEEVTVKTKQGYRAVNIEPGLIQARQYYRYYSKKTFLRR
jgi:hypothetical protein